MRRLLLLAALLSACGDPLATGDFAGDIKLQFQAVVWGEQPYDIAPIAPSLGVLWKQIDGNGFALSEVTALGAARFPAIVEVDILDRPPIEAELGCPIVFDDLDGDGQFGESDPILAVSWNQFLGFDPSEAYQLVEGICDQEGAPTGELMTFTDRPIAISFLEAPDVFPEQRLPGACVAFF